LNRLLNSSERISVIIKRTDAYVYMPVTYDVPALYVQGHACTYAFTKAIPSKT